MHFWCYMWTFSMAMRKWFLISENVISIVAQIRCLIKTKNKNICFKEIFKWFGFRHPIGTDGSSFCFEFRFLLCHHHKAHFSLPRVADLNSYHLSTKWLNPVLYSILLSHAKYLNNFLTVYRIHTLHKEQCVCQTLHYRN